jgi:hypothetical protein
MIFTPALCIAPTQLDLPAIDPSIQRVVLRALRALARIVGRSHDVAELPRHVLRPRIARELRSSSEAIDRSTVSWDRSHVSFFTNVAKSAAAFDAS